MKLKEFDMDILEELDVLAKLPPVPEMAKRCRIEIGSLRNKIIQMEQTIIALETLRPMWAQGWTSDGQAAQASAAALSEVWEILEVKNQTEAMEKLRLMVKGREQ